jgi:hypothetical protein
MTKPAFVQPPRFAVWLVDLFTPYEQAESISGDLLEEFNDLVLKSGATFARRWYWRHTVKTVANLVSSGFRVAPWRIAGAVLLGHLLLWYGFVLPEKAIVAVLRIFPVYPNYDHKNIVALWMFWVPLAIQIGWFIVAIFVGCLVAAAAKGREMVATMTLGFTLLAPRLVGMVVHWPPPVPRFLRLDFVLVLIVAFVIGGGIVRKFRLAVAPRRSASHC